MTLQGTPETYSSVPVATHLHTAAAAYVEPAIYSAAASAAALVLLQ